MAVAKSRSADKCHIEPSLQIAPGAPNRFRPDIDGLRAVAIVLVVAYHSGVPHFASGYVGVDIFFVISGYLIMSQLDKELDKSGIVRLRTFWSRRARRLVPAAAMMLLFVTIAGQVVYSPLHWRALAIETLATTFYASNEYFLRASTDYFAPVLTSSPLLHTWSLAVEEQFYIVWPTLLVLVTKVVGGGSRGKRVRIITVSVAGVLSFLFALNLLAINAPSAYYASSARAWEFGIGAVLAMTSTRVRTWNRGRSWVLAAGGLVLLGWAMATITDQTPFPGWAALLPALAAAALILAGGGHDDLCAKTLGWPPLQALGRLSYSWYLWHWPVIVLGIRWLDSDTVQTRVQLAMISLLPAFFFHRYVETVLRTSPRLIASNRRTAATMAAFVLVVSSGAGVLAFRAHQAMQDPDIQ